MQVSSYLKRIGYGGAVAPNATTLRALHRAHLIQIAYENLDLHLEPRRALGLDLAQIYDKIVRGGRGGWCYEMNGLFAWALREIGFKVRLLGSAVGRRQNPAAMADSHLLLHVVAPSEPHRAWLADVGFGNAFLEPLPLHPGKYQQDGFRYQLEQDEAGQWWFTNHAQGGAGYDFGLQALEMGDFATPCRWLQTSPDSGFVRVAVCHRHVPGGQIVTLRGLTLSTVDGAQRRDEVIASRSDYFKTLQQTFGLNVSDTAVFWQRAQQMHADWLTQQNS